MVMESNEEWTVVGTLDELPDQTMDELLLRPQHIFPAPQSTTQHIDAMIPDTVQQWYQQLKRNQQDKDQASEIAEAFKQLNHSKIEEEKKYMTDDERRKMKIVERLRVRLAQKKQ